jgi:hypothetical protein
MKDLPMNAAAKIVPLRKDTNEDSDPIVLLLAERKRVSEELTRLAAIDGPVRSAEAALGGINRAIDALGAKEWDHSKALKNERPVVWGELPSQEQPSGTARSEQPRRSCATIVAQRHMGRSLSSACASRWSA